MNTKKPLTLGNLAFRNGDYLKALEYYEEGLRCQPQLRNIYCQNIRLANSRNGKKALAPNEDNYQAQTDSSTKNLIKELIKTINPLELRVSILEAEEILSEWVYIANKFSHVVYTAIFGAYDTLKPPQRIEKNFEYICFTDQDLCPSSKFKIRKIKQIFRDPTKNARLLKIMPHIFLPATAITIWVDGSTKLRGRKLSDLVNSSLSEHDVAVHEHFQRNCIYDEAIECIKQKKDDEQKINKLVEFLNLENYPKNNGLVETAQLIRRKGVASVRFNSLWWKVLNLFSKRDQLSFNYAAWKLNIAYKTLEGHQWLDPFFKNYLHDGEKKRKPTRHPSINIIMLVRNALELTKIATKTLLDITDYNNYRLTIVDNASDIETKEYLSALERSNQKVKIITNTTNKSFSEANNNGVDSHNSECVLFINNDIEIISPDWLARLVDELMSSEKTGAVGPILLYPDYTIQSASIEVTHDNNKNMVVPCNELRSYRHTGFAHALTGGCLLVRMAVHRLIGGYDERFFYGQEDIDYCLKIREAGFHLKLVAASEVIHHESATRKFGLATINNRKIIRKKWQLRSHIIPHPGQEVTKKDLAFKDVVLKNDLTYKTFLDMAHDIRKKVELLPDCLDLIVGIPRSGMIPAYQIGLQLNLPVISIDELAAQISCHKGDRERKPLNAKTINVLVIDDSINNGNAYRRALKLLPDKYLGATCKYNFFAVYGSENWLSDAVKVLHRVPTPRIFQWNYLNHGITQFACFDMDGVLCLDPADEENDDGKFYTEFVLNAKPLFIPKFEIRAIVTSRLEKYRPQTVEWLNKNNVKYKELYMLDLPNKEARIKLKAHAPFKAEVYTQLCDTIIFYESNKGQSQEIANLTGKPVICTEDDSFIMGRLKA